MATRDITIGARETLTLIRIIYIAIIGSAFSSYLSKLLPSDAIILSFSFVFFVACESVARTLACNLIFRDSQISSAQQISFSQGTIFFETFAIIFASHWVLNYLDVSMSPTTERTSILALLGFVLFNMANNSWHVYHYHKYDYIKIPLRSLPWHAVRHDLYEANHQCKVPFVAGAIEKDIEFTESLLRKENLEIPQEGLWFRDLKLGHSSMFPLHWYYLSRAYRNILVQIYAMNLLVLNFISASTLALLYFYPHYISNFVKTVPLSNNWTWALPFYILVLTLLFYYATTCLEVQRQIIVRRTKGEPLIILFDPKLPPTRAEEFTQILGNLGVIILYLVLTFIVIDSSSDTTVQSKYGLWTILLNLFIAFGVAKMSRSPDKVNELSENMEKASKVIVDHPGLKPT